MLLFSYYLAEEIIITTGYNGRILSDTEVIKVEKKNDQVTTTTRKCNSLIFPITVSGAAASYLSETNTNIICGGYDSIKRTYSRRCFKLNISSMSWDEVISLNIKRGYHAMTSIGQTLVTCGGYTSGNTRISSCEKLTNGQWTMIQSLPTELDTHCMVTIDNSTILVIGGDSNSGVRKIKMMLNIRKVVTLVIFQTCFTSIKLLILLPFCLIFRRLARCINTRLKGMNGKKRTLQ